MEHLNKDETSRYSRQMLCPEIGKKGQLALKSKSVLIVGAGGLGCPASLYLTAAGIGVLGFVDNDIVETSNLHRQVLHSEASLGQPKTKSAVERLQQLNSNVKFNEHHVRLTAKNASSVIENYDIVIDGTDNPMSRYFLNDCCILLKKPLISGSALRFEGQLTVYNYNLDTACYRCLFPQPPQPGTVTNCADGGVLGVVPGIIGNLQALEAIKIACGLQPSYSGVLLLFNALDGKFRHVQLRKRNLDCPSCGENPTINPTTFDYESFCGVKCDLSSELKILELNERITPQQYFKILESKKPHILIDVRPQLQQDITKLENAISIPLSEIIKDFELQKIQKLVNEKLPSSKEDKELFFICRRGNASQKAVREIKNRILQKNMAQNWELKDIIGGLEKWSKEIDKEFPMY